MLDDGALPPTWNMALDEALLAAGGPPTLRLYGWCPHAVSLGYFQALANFADLSPGTAIVRRCTGGGAIHHGDELTFALAVDADMLPADVDADYALLHDAVANALLDLGVKVRRLDTGPAPSARPAARWCFEVPGRHDLVVDGRKLCGSAQRRVRVGRARVLHHGSIVLARPALTPFVAAVADVVDSPAARQRLRPLLASHFGQALGLLPVTGSATPAEMALAAALCAGRYASPAFLRRR